MSGASFSALRSRNFRFFIAGQGISLIGTWMQQIAMSWLVYRLTHSAFLLGVVSFAGQAPTFFLSPFAGVWADRTNKRRLLMITQTMLMLQAAGLAILTLLGVIRVWHIIALDLFFGVVNSADIPTRQSFLIEMVDHKEDIGNAIALNATIVNGTRLLGPTIAGFLIALSNEGVCFLVNAVSFLAVLAALALMRVPGSAKEAGSKSLLAGLAEGFRYVRASLPISALLFLLGTISLLGLPYATLMPIFATSVLKGGPDTLGLLMGTSGFGALMGALFLAYRKNVRGLVRLTAFCSGLFGAALISFSYSRWLGVSLISLFFSGFGIMVMMAACNTVLQTIVADEMRGRVMSFYVMAFMGLAPFGGLLAGFVAERIGAPLTVRLGGLACIASAVYFVSLLPKLRSVIRPIYIQKGIIPEPVLPEVAMGLPPASGTIERRINR